MRAYVPLLMLCACFPAASGGPTSGLTDDTGLTTVLSPTADTAESGGDTGTGPDDTGTSTTDTGPPPDLLLADGDELSGSYHVGRFEVPVGVTVTVTGNTPLVVEAEGVYIHGTLLADGQGHDGGRGLGAGRGHGYETAGSGGGFGGAGGAGNDVYGAFYGNDPWFDGGASVHHLCDPLGSGGGEGDHGRGGYGGGAIRLTADEIVIDGLVSARGGLGLCDASFSNGSYGGGGGAGGLVELRTAALTGSGAVDVSGGSPCDDSVRHAGGGGGGWVVLQSPGPAGLTIDVAAGAGSDPSSEWEPAQVGRVSIDGDGDGLGEDEELALGLDPENPDTDGDGIDDGTQAIVVCTNPI